MSLASDRPEFTPPSTSGRGRAIGLAVLAHAFLIAALTWGVGWKREPTNAPVQAELWSTTVQQAAPALVEPTPPPPQIEPKPEPKVEPQPPPPKPAKPVKVVEPEPEPEPKIDPQIAIEKAKKEEKKKLEKKKADEAKEKAKALAKKEAEEEAAEEARLEALNKKKRALEAKKLEAKKVADAKAAENDKKYEASLKAAREANLKRIAGIAGASGGETATGTAKQSTGPSAGYGARLSAKLKPNIVFTSDVSGNIEVGVEVRSSADGTITSRRIIKPSGNKAWDEAVLRAFDKMEIMPKDTDGRAPPILEVFSKPKDLL
jgi:colicin import membrane protein